MSWLNNCNIQEHYNYIDYSLNDVIYKGKRYVLHFKWHEPMGDDFKVYIAEFYDENHKLIFNLHMDKLLNKDYEYEELTKPDIYIKKFNKYLLFKKMNN